MKTFHNTFGNRTRDLPACSEVPQTTEPTRAPPYLDINLHSNQESSSNISLLVYLCLVTYSKADAGGRAVYVCGRLISGIAGCSYTFVSMDARLLCLLCFM